MSEKEEFVRVYTASLAEAHVIKGRLESEGIPAFLRYESAGPVFGITVDGIGDAAIFVPKRLAEDAIRVLESEVSEGDPEAGGEEEETN